MSFVNMLAVMGSISELHCIDLRIQSLYQQKFSLMRLTTHFGRMQCKMNRLKPNEMTKFRLFNFSHDIPKESTTYFTNPSNILQLQQQGVIADFLHEDIDGPQAVVPVRDYQGSYVQPGQCAYDPQTGEALEPGEVYMNKEEAEELYKAYISEIDAREKEIDMEIESLKAKRTAITQIKEEAQKYIAEGIKTAFRNNYMG